jgi:hypothetical protein
MTGHERVVAQVMVAALAGCAVVGVLLISMWGATGAAADRALYLVSWNVVLAVITYRRLGVNATVFGLRRRIARLGQERVS